MKPSFRMLVAGAGACAAGFVALLILAYGSDRAGWLDAAALEGFRGLQRPAVAEPSERIASLADPGPFALLALLVVGVALVRRRLGHAVAAAVILAGANITTQLLKPLLAQPRQMDLFAPVVSAEAFPSGHATASMSIALAAVLVAPRGLRPAAAAAGAAYTLAVSFSLLSLDWHFPSDVVGGYLVATGWALAVLAALRLAADRQAAPADRARARFGRDLAVAVAGAAAVLGALGLGLALPHLDRVVDYAARHTAFAAVAAAIALAATALVAAATVASARYR